MPDDLDILYVLCDIEGTTTSIQFVHDVLFPYAKKRIGDYVREHAEEAALAPALEGVRETLRDEQEIGKASLDQIVAALEQWIQEDRKHTALKDIQGKLWRQGYLDGDFQGHVYPDVPEAFQRWQEAGLRMGIYSSGSVEAQQLIFGYSEAGDLRGYLSHYFDTRIGHKRETESYAAIAEAIGLDSGHFLFLSDVVAELDAAAEAGMHTIQLLRPGTEAGDHHPTAADFSEILV